MINCNRYIVGLVILLFVNLHCASAAHFVLVHGSGHGAWCWYKLATLLEQAGHNVTAIDLAYSGRNQVPLEAVSTINDYHKPLFEYMASLSPKDRVILVGHSYGGYAVSSAMERFRKKIVCGVFASAFMTGPNLTFGQVQKKFPLSRAFFEDSTSIGDPPTIVLFGPNFLATRFYQNSPPEDYKLGNYSIRVTKYFYGNVTERQLLVSKERYGSVPRAYIIAGSDRAITPDLQRFFIESNPPNEVRKIVGADHLLMLSKPQQFANYLQQIARRFPS